MEANDIYRGIAAAVESAKPAQEYCFFGINSWLTCLTKSEWAAWAQFIGVGVALLTAIKGPAIQRAHNNKHAKKMLLSFILSLRQSANYTALYFQRPEQGTPVDVVVSLFDAGAAPLASFPFSELGDHEISLEAMTLSAFAKTAVKAFERPIPAENRHLLFVDLRNQCDQALKRFWPDHKVQ